MGWSDAGLTICSDQNVVSVGVRIVLLRLQTIYLVSGLISTCNQRQEIEELLVGCGVGNILTWEERERERGHIDRTSSQQTVKLKCKRGVTVNIFEYRSHK